MEFIERREGSTTTLQWRIKGLKTLFDSSKGEIKSEVVKSDKFGGGCVVELCRTKFSRYYYVYFQTMAGLVLSE